MKRFRRKSRQRTFVYCPTCGFELCAGGEFISDDERGVQYRCAHCDAPSTWDFDLFPVPVLVEQNFCSRQEEWVGYPMDICGYHQVPWPCDDERDRVARLAASIRQNKRLGLTGGET